MQKWEYEAYYGGSLVTATLNEMGEDGWELIGLVYDGDNRGHFHYVFKRPVEETKVEELPKLDHSYSTIRVAFPHTITDAEIKHMEDAGYEFDRSSFGRDQYGAWTYLFKRKVQ